MYKISNPESFRNNIRKKIQLVLDDEKKAINLEIGIYNYVIREANTKKIVKKWENQYFTQLYINHLRSIYMNLQDEQLLERIKNDTVKSQNVAFLTHQELKPDHWKELIEKKIQKDASKYTNNIQASTDMYVCTKCKSRRCTFVEVQIRSSDEGSTIFVTCLDCGKQFKR